jgi:hypothetical protein
MKPWPPALVLLAVATFAFGGAWQLHATAAADLTRARHLQDVEVPDPGESRRGPARTGGSSIPFATRSTSAGTSKATPLRVETAVRSLSTRQAESALAVRR